MWRCNPRGEFTVSRPKGNLLGQAPGRNSALGLLLSPGVTQRDRAIENRLAWLHRVNPEAAQTG